ncbi:MAG: hypothetical protein GF416_07705 [Candidatus Altiarchaeales archaeon]|nr:hypothetical protein [Candidatus Altiarchaeales archaeon]MBD3416997.1 hypothetical protein [Candidatus Altiarchaeales archaeon]
MALGEFLYLGVLLVVSSGLALLFRRMGHSTIAGYLIGGVVFHSFVTPSEAFDFLSYLGVVLLLFFVGLEFSLGRIKGLGRGVFYVGVADFLVNFSLGLVLGWLFDFNAYETLLLGGIVYISSSAVISKILLESDCMDRKETKTILGVLIFEDLVMVVLLAFFTSFSANPVFDLARLTPAFGKAAVFCGFFILFYNRIRDLFDWMFLVESDEIFLLSVMGVVFLVSFAAQAMDLSEAIGAFFIGSAMADTKHQRRIKALLKPVGYFASAIFFLSFGLRVDILEVGSQTILIVGVMILASMAGKMMTGYSARAFKGLNREEAMHVGWTLFPRGEFSIIIASIFVVESHGRHNLNEIVAIYVLALMVLSTFLIRRYTRKCARK